MTKPLVSIVMTTFNRPVQLALTLRSIHDQKVDDLEIVIVDDGVDDPITPWVALTYDAKYIRLERPASLAYRNQARPLNVGIRHATADTIILQNAECMHVKDDTIVRLVNACGERTVAFAHVIALDPEGHEEQVYCGMENQRPYFFCGAIRRRWLERLRGFDEDFIGYGYEDDDMAERLLREGLHFKYTDVLVHHQWHEPAGEIDMGRNEQMFLQKQHEPTVRNLSREWGAL